MKSKEESKHRAAEKGLFGKKGEKKEPMIREKNNNSRKREEEESQGGKGGHWNGKSP